MSTLNKLAVPPNDAKLNELEEKIAQLIAIRSRMEGQKIALENGIASLTARINGLYARRTVELNFKLPL